MDDPEAIYRNRKILNAPKKNPEQVPGQFPDTPSPSTSVPRVTFAEEEEHIPEQPLPPLTEYIEEYDRLEAERIELERQLEDEELRELEDALSDVPEHNQSYYFSYNAAESEDSEEETQQILPQPVIVQPVSTMATEKRMPLVHERHAPSFDPVKDRDLDRYFEDLEELFTHAGITSNERKKFYGQRYVKGDASKAWKAAEHYENGTYLNWKKEIYAYYPGASADAEDYYTRAGIEELVQQTKQRGFRTTGD